MKMTYDKMMASYNKFEKLGYIDDVKMITVKGIDALNLFNKHPNTLYKINGIYLSKTDVSFLNQIKEIEDLFID